MLKLLFTIIWLFIAYVLCNLGLDWISLGHGLHPAISFPFSVVALAIALYFPFPSAFKEYHHDPLRSSTRYHSSLGK